MLGKLTESEIESVLKNNILGRLGCHDGFRTYVVPVSYVYDGRELILHSVEGQKIHMMRQNNRVCLLVDEIHGFTNWKSVLVQGIYQEITDEMQRYQAMKIFVERMMKLKISATAQPPDMSAERSRPHQPGSVKPVIYRILIEEKSGRFEKE
jgi:nitroimidazol reductase NimA-like FMN-containing flavoprotein (pyridoxamine 5'-phosphate oxidase superfamily)